jgi:hypothetical protein
VLMLLILVKLRKICLYPFKFLLFNLFIALCDLSKSCLSLLRYSMVLADNVDGGDDLDLIVSTMNGNVFCFSTPVPHHPLKA